MSVMTADDIAERKSRDNARLKRVATRHGAAFLAAITLWGAADAWAISSGWALANLVAVLNAIFAGVAMSYLAHEWGHFTGARISGGVSPVLKEPQSFFMFSFKQDQSTRGQFLSMSAGGPVANWSLAFLVLILVPMETASQAMLLAATTAIAVSVSVFEIPVMNRVMYGDDPEETIQSRLKEVGDTPRLSGIVVGAIVFLIAL